MNIRVTLYRAKERVKRKIEQFRFGKCAVLLYHRVANLDTDPQQLAVSIENFKMQMDILKKEYTPLTVSEFESLISSGKKFPPRAILLTFDDGYADNYLNAMPILEQAKIQALFYVCIGNLDSNKEFWWDEVERLLLLPNSFPDEFNFIVCNKRFSTHGAQPMSKEQIYQEILPLLRCLSFVEREKEINILRSLSFTKIPRDDYRSLSATELKNFIASKSVVLGAHTKNHCSLAALNYEEQYNEIFSSKNYLEQLTGKKIDHFSYPFGTREDYNASTEKICSQLGLKWVAANFPGIVTGKSQALSFPRFIVRNWGPDRFKKEINSFFRS